MANDMFNPAMFLDATTDSQMDTKLIPCPEGEYLGIIDDVKIRTWTKKDNPSEGGVVLDVFWNIEDEGVKQTLGRTKVTVKQGVMLDLTDQGQLDCAKGRNVQLGRLREATGLNKPGEPFAMNMLPGKMAKVLIKHRTDGEDIYADVKGVAPLQ